MAESRNDTPSQYSAVPGELQAPPQWAGRNRDKRPINPVTGALAAPTDLMTRIIFPQAVASVERYGLAGTGFVVGTS